MRERKYSTAAIGDRIEEFLNCVLDGANIDVEYEIADHSGAEEDFETPDVIVKFTGPDVDRLLENRAELLLATEHLTMEMLRMPSDDHSRLSFDANDYRLLRIEELRLSAAAAAEKVKRTGMPFQFNPMNSRERRVIHLALRNETELRSESLGAAGHRHVVVYPAGMPSLPEPPPQPYAPYAADRRSGPPRGDRGNRPPRGGSNRARGRGPR